MRVLYAEDDPAGADLTRRWLARQTPPVRLDLVATRGEALARLTGAVPPPYDVVLTGFRLPDGSGLALVADIRAKALPVAVVVITGAGDEETAVTALRTGADDYVVKRGDYLDRLLLTLESAVHRHGAETARRGRPLTVLYAEHNAADADLTRRHFARHASHLRLDVVASGPAALERLRAPVAPSTHDVVLLDYRLPGLSGLDILKALSQERDLDLPVILVTGQGDEDVALQALKLGATGYVIKTPGYLYRLPVEIENAHVRAGRLREQAALRESQERLARTEEVALVMIAHIGLDGRWLKVPRRLGQLLGRSEAELLARTVRDVLHPEDVEAAWAECQRLIGGDVESVVLEKRLVRADGAFVWCYINISIVADARGRPLHFLGYLKDVSDQKQAVKALQASEARTRAILRAMPDLVFLQTPDGVYLDYLARVRSDLYLPPEAFLGRSMHDVLPPEVSRARLAGVGRAALSPEPQVAEYTLEIGGEIRHFEARMVRTDDGNVLTVVRNVTEQVRAAEALRDSHRRIADLAGRLIASQEEERARIARALHDDLGQQMAALLLRLRLLRRHLPDVEHSVAGQEIGRLERQARDVSERMRWLSHELHPAILQQLGLAAAVRSFCDELSRGSGLEVRLELDEGIGPLPPATELCLYRVVQEGLRNALRHSGASHAVVRIARPPEALELSVADEGVGFDLQHVPKGLGLVSLEERVRLCGGTLHVDARPGAGTRVRVRVPLPS
jgi:PAS domain S-box-containing protein